MESHIVVPNNNQVSKLIFSVWQVSGIPDYSIETILPKGVVDMVFNFSGSTIIQAQIDKYEVKLPKCYINGFNTIPVSLYIPGYQSFFGIRFNPLAISTLFGINPGELSNQSIDLTLVSKSIEMVWDKLAEASSFDQRVNIFIHWLISKQPKFSLKDTVLMDFMYYNKDSDTTVLSLSKDLLLSSRQLSRKFEALTGMSTEKVLLYRKYLRAQRLLHETSYSLTDIAYDCNFYDQSHFIRSFRAFTKLTPGEYRKIKTPLPGHIFQ